MLSRNKLSDKLGRRDIQFYDLYKLDKPEDNMKLLKAKELPFEGILKGSWLDPNTNKQTEITDDNEPLYGDIEVDDFNEIFNDQDIIRDRYGKSLNVRLFFNKRSAQVKR